MASTPDTSDGHGQDRADSKATVPDTASSPEIAPEPTLDAKPVPDALPRFLQARQQSTPEPPPVTTTLTAVASLMIIGLADQWLGAGTARLVALVALIPDVWWLAALGRFGFVFGLMAAHRYGGRTRQDNRLTAVSVVLLAFGITLVSVPMVQIPQLVHPRILTGATIVASFALGALGGIALRRSSVTPALPIAAWAAGEAIGALTTGTTIATLTPPGLVAIAGTVGGVASLMLVATSAGRWGSASRWIAASLGTIVAVGTATLAVSILSNPATVANPGRVPVGKSLFTSVADPESAETHTRALWGPGGRFDLTATPDGGRWVYLDAVPFGYVGPSGRLRADGALLPLTLPGPKERVLIAGIGAGQELRAALEVGATTVTVADPHPGAFDAVTAAISEAGGPVLTSRPGVRLVAEEARAHLRASETTYDLIYVTLAAAGASAEPGRVAGATQFTREAFADYVNHLSPEGMLVIRVHDDHELWRAFNTAFQVMGDLGAPTPTDAIRHLLAVNDGTSGMDTEQLVLPVLMVRRTAFTEPLAQRILQFLLQSPFPPLFVPFQEARSVLSAVAAPGGPGAAEAQVPFDIRPATDDHPYFFEPFPLPPWSWLVATLTMIGTTIVGTFMATRRPAEFDDFLDDADEAMTDTRPAPNDTYPWRAIGFLGAGGVTMGLTYSALLWHLPLIAGRADLTTAGGTAALWAGAVIASLLVHRAHRNQIRAVAGWGALGVALYPIALTELLPLASPLIIGQTLELRVIAASLLLLPIGLGIGSHLPAALRLLAISHRSGWEPIAWATFLASAAIGSAVASILSRTLGDTTPILIGIATGIAGFLAIGLRWFDHEAPPETVVVRPAMSDGPGSPGLD